MRYCDNCGAELSEGAEFCDECGAKVEESAQEKQNVEPQPKSKKNKGTPVIIISILLVVCIAGVAGYFIYNNYSGKKQTTKENAPIKKESIVKKDNLLETVPWEKDSKETTKKISKFTENSLTDYSSVPLKTVYDKEIVTVIKEQYKKIDGTEYYNIDYNYDNDNYVAVIQKKEKTELAELYHNDKKVALDSDEGEAYQQEVFKTTYAKVVDDKKKAEDGKNIFNENRIGKYSNGYWAMDLKSIDNSAKTIVYDGYEYGASVAEPVYTNGMGTIVDANTLEISGVTIQFKDDTTFFIEKGTDAMIFSSQAGGSSSHDVAHGAGDYTKGKNPEGQFTMPQKSAVIIAAGKFWPSGNGYNAKCYIEISNVSSTGFDFEIFGRDAEGDNFRTVFVYHRAVYKDANTAVFQGEKYRLTFQCYDPGYVTISGFSEWIPDGTTLNNNNYLGVS